MSATAANPTARPRIPVTVLAGCLGAGRTALPGRILAGAHGRRRAVIVGGFGIDGGLVVDAGGGVFETDDGCIRRTVRGGLIRIIGSLPGRRGRFDAIPVGTTGLAGPAPVAQILLVDGLAAGTGAPAVPAPSRPAS